MDPVFDAIQQNLNSALSVPFVSSAVTLGLAFYAYKAAPELPSFMEELFLNVFFQIFVGFLVLYMSTQNFMLSLVVSVVFIYGMKMLSGVKEGMTGFPEAKSKLDIAYAEGQMGGSGCNPDYLKYMMDSYFIKNSNKDTKVGWYWVPGGYRTFGKRAVGECLKSHGRTPDWKY